MVTKISLLHKPELSIQTASRLVVGPNLQAVLVCLFLPCPCECGLEQRTADAHTSAIGSNIHAELCYFCATYAKHAENLSLGLGDQYDGVTGLDQSLVGGSFRLAVDRSLGDDVDAFRCHSFV